MKAGRPKGTTGIKWGKGRGHKKPERPQQTMLSLPTGLGPEALDHLVALYGGMERACKDLRISRALMQRYLAGTTEPPFTLLLAIYWQGPVGFGQAFEESHWTHQHNAHLKRQAEERLTRVLTALDGLVAQIGETHEASGLIATKVAQALSDAPLETLSMPGKMCEVGLPPPLTIGVPQ